MSVTPGQKLLHYRVVEKIGEGGMGEVWRAEDTHLDRQVAIKVLPKSTADNTQLLARLEREAKSIAALSHPGILAVYDFGTHEGMSFVITELLEGETLREVLAKGRIGARKAAEFGRQVARGLASAHDKGIVHRDIKPENLFVTLDGRIKILDFGLAAVKSVPGQAAESDPSEVTRTSLTAPGTVLGTADYMSPEQVRGEPSDQRSDIFSLGSVLYEMLAAARPFRRDTAAETMTAILREEPPDLMTMADDVSPALTTITRRCLEKRPGERFHSAHDLAFSLETLSDASVVSTPSSPAVAAEVTPRRSGFFLPALLLVAGIAIGAIGLLWLRPPARSDEPPTSRVLSARRGTVTNARFVPGDDSALYSARWAAEPLRVYPATWENRTSDPLGIGDVDLLSVSASGELAVSMDRRHLVGWELIGTLAVVRPGGSAPRPVLENVHVADWSPDGSNIAASHLVDGVVRLEYPIGTVLYESEGWISDIRFHPNGDRILIADNPERGDNFSVARIVYLDGRVETVGGNASWGAVWGPDEESVWFCNGQHIFVADPGEEPRAVHDYLTPTRLLDIDSRGRALVAVATIRREMIVREAGAGSDVDRSWLDWTTPRVLSADGRFVLFEEGNIGSEEGYAVFLRELSGGAPLQLGLGAIIALSPDSDWVALLQRPFADDRRLVLVPTGPGTPRQVDVGDLRPAAKSGVWIGGDGAGAPDRLVFTGRTGDGPLRTQRLELTDGALPEPISPEGMAIDTAPPVVSNAGDRVLIKPVGGSAVEFGLDGSGPRDGPGLEPTDRPLRYGLGDTHVYVQQGASTPATIVRVDLATGKREKWRELTPLDPGGVFAVDRTMISADGQAYLYSNRRVISRLMLLEGLSP